MSACLLHWNQRPIIPMEASRRVKIETGTSSWVKCEGSAHCFLHPTVNKEYYLEVMRWLLEVIRQKRTEFWKNQSWILRHDNAPAHTSILVREFLAKNKIVTTVFIGLGLRRLFPFPKTKDTNEMKVFCYDWGHKRKIETEAVGGTKKLISEGFRGLEKLLA